MDRRVTTTKRDRNGKIVALCHAGQPWSPRKATDVIRDINSSKKSYYVKEAERRTYVRVSAGSLQTTTDEASENNLNNLPTT
ncbi:MAG: DUF3892 domain-containing protein [Myxococcales bacterium]|nr:DUF3892 domain-containing protein [Myxococcales bacterium]